MCSDRRLRAPGAASARAGAAAAPCRSPRRSLPPPRARRARRSAATRSASASPPSTRCARSRRCSSLSKCSGLISASSADELRMREHAGERLALEPLPRVDQPRRGGRAGRGAARRPQLNREPELVVREPPRLVALGRLGNAVQDVLHAQIRVLPVARAIELQTARDGRHTALASPSRSSKPAGSSAGSLPFGSATTRTSKPWLQRELHPAQRRLLAGGVRVEAEEEPLRQPRRARAAAARSAPCPSTRRPAAGPPAGARSRRCSPRRRSRGPPS